MPKIRDYATADNATAALIKEGLPAKPGEVTLVQDPATSRWRPVFNVNAATPPAFIERLKEEGFAWEVAELPPGPTADPRVIDGTMPEPEPDETENHGGGHGNQHGQDPGPAPEPKDRQTFTVPEGHEAVRDAEGRATGETRPIVAASVVPVSRVAGDDFSAVATVYVPAEEVTRPRVINPHVSDLFFNYEHAGFATLEEAAEPEGAREAIRKDAEEFTASVLGAFGVAINVDELVEDFFARV